jgi:hypothetical protein
MTEPRVKSLRYRAFVSASGAHRMKIHILKHAAGKPFRVHVSVTDDKDHTIEGESGYVGTDVTEPPIVKCFEWACRQAEEKGWKPSKRSGRNLRMLSGIPDPSTLPRRPGRPRAVA